MAQKIKAVYENEVVPYLKETFENVDIFDMLLTVSVVPGGPGQAASGRPGGEAKRKEALCSRASARCGS